MPKSKKDKKRPNALSFDDELDAEADPSPTMGTKKMGKCQVLYPTVGAKCLTLQRRVAPLNTRGPIRGAHCHPAGRKCVLLAEE